MSEIMHEYISYLQSDDSLTKYQRYELAKDCVKDLAKTSAEYDILIKRICELLDI